MLAVRPGGRPLKAVLYSDQVIAENDRVDRYLLRLMPARPRIGYLPSAPGPDHASGGSTRAFLARLRQTDMIEPLRRYATAGGVLVGTSA